MIRPGSGGSRLETVFPSQNGHVFYNNALPKLLNGLDTDAVPHGFRSSFADWCAHADVHPDVRERCLAHVVGDQVVEAYLRHPGRASPPTAARAVPAPPPVPFASTAQPPARLPGRAPTADGGSFLLRPSPQRGPHLDPHPVVPLACGGLGAGEVPTRQATGRVSSRISSAPCGA